MLHSQNRTAYINGKIWTVDARQPEVSAVVTEGEKIIYTGTNEQAKALVAGCGTVVDLAGKRVLPGFIDNHTHFLAGGFYLGGINLRPAKSVAEFKAIIKNYAQVHPGEWITGGDWDHEAWDIKDLPRKEWLDEVAPDNPVFVSRFDGHMGVANSKALALAGITKQSPVPAGGETEKDSATGELTGILKDNAMNAMFAAIPEPSEKQYDNALQLAIAEAHRNGVTSVQDITLKPDLAAFYRAEKSGKLNLKVYSRSPIADYNHLVSLGISSGSRSGNITLGSLKAFADGSLGSSTAWFFQPYASNAAVTGLPNDIISDGRLLKWCIDADKNGLQLCIHAIGDKANATILDYYEEVNKVNPLRERRMRIEHAQHIRKQDVPRFAKLAVIASMQPYHCIDDGVWAVKRIGEERLKEAYPIKSLIESGAVVCFGSDWTVAPINPLLGIYAAVTRRTLDGKNPGGWIPEQKITVEQAIECYTINNAYAAFEENIKGSIQPGKDADMVILSDDILSIDPVKIKEVTVLKTIFNGKVVYSAKQE